MNRRLDSRLSRLLGELATTFRCEARAGLPRTARSEDVEDLAQEMAASFIKAWRQGACRDASDAGAKRIAKVCCRRTAATESRRALAAKRQAIEIDLSDCQDWLAGKEAEDVRSELWLRELAALADGLPGEMLDDIMAGKVGASGGVGVRRFASERGVSVRKGLDTLARVRALVEASR